MIFKNKYSRLFLVLSYISIVTILLNGDTYASPSNSWNVTGKGSIVEIFYRNGQKLFQYAALHLESGYFRMCYGPESSWGTSIILLPSFWENGIYYQGAPISYTWRTKGSDLLITFTGNLTQLEINGNILISPPTQNLLLAKIDVNIKGKVKPDYRQGESFKPVMLSSMHVSKKIWDTQEAYVNSKSYKIPMKGRLKRSLSKSMVFGLKGGSSNWKTNAPTIEVRLDRPMQITGWITQSSNPNDDNVGFWAATKKIIHSWQYTIIAKP